MSSFDLENKLSTVRRLCLWFTMGAVVLILGGGYYSFFKHYPPSQVVEPFLYGLLTSTLLAVTIVVITIQQIYSYFYKKWFVTPILKQQLGEVIFRPRHCMSANLARQSALFPDFQRCQGDNFLYFSQNKVSITLSNLKLFQYFRTEKGSHQSLCFKGLFVAMKLPKNFQTTLLLREKRWFSISKAHFAGQALSSVKILSPEFSKRFEVWADDQITSRKLLTPELIDKITTLSKSHPFALSLTENSVYLSVKHTLDFSPRLYFLPERSYEKRSAQIQQTLSVILNLVKTLRLEQRQ